MPKFQNHGMKNRRKELRIIVVSFILWEVFCPYHGLEGIKSDAGRARCFTICHASKSSSHFSQGGLMGMVSKIVARADEIKGSVIT
eukprot:6039091-Ditylum_brightwellii.AAC.1